MWKAATTARRRAEPRSPSTTAAPAPTCSPSPETSRPPPPQRPPPNSATAPRPKTCASEPPRSPRKDSPHDRPRHPARARKARPRPRPRRNRLTQEDAMTPIARYRVATEAWRRADRARRKAALERAYAIADMVATAPPGSDPVRAVARHVRLSPASVQRLLDKARKSCSTEGDT